MGEITRDLIEDAQLVLDESGGSLVRSHLLEDVPGDGDSQLWNAVLDPRIPRYGSPHPVVPGIRVTNISASSVDDGIVKVVITYSRPSSEEDTPYDPDTGAASDPDGRGTLSMSTNIIDEETNNAVDGVGLIVIYTGRLTDEAGNPVEVEDDPQVATITVGRPMSVVTFTRKETISPMLKSTRLVGTINSRSLGFFSPKTLLCSRIDATTSDDGLTFDVSYEFQFNRKTWDAEVVYIDKETGHPPPDIQISGDPYEVKRDGLVVARNGVSVYRVYPVSDFGELNLPWETGGKRSL